MNRRSLFKTLAAIPFLGRIIPASALQEPPRAPVNLAQVRDLLLPGLRSQRSPEYGIFGAERFWYAETDIQVDYGNDRLLVKVVDREHHRSAVGIIRRSDLEGKIYIRKFRPLLREMAKRFLAGTTVEKIELTMDEVAREDW
jgi:hypothetical protein